MRRAHARSAATLEEHVTTEPRGGDDRRPRLLRDVGAALHDTALEHQLRATIAEYVVSVRDAFAAETVLEQVRSAVLYATRELPGGHRGALMDRVATWVSEAYESES